MDDKTRAKKGVFAALFGIVSNVLVASMKVVIGFITNTISIVADGANNFGDALSSFISLFGFALSRKKADKKHPFGHQRIEYLSAFIVSCIIIALGVELIITSIQKIITPEEASDKFVLNVVILLIAIVVKIIQALVNYKTGKAINSDVLIATAADSRNDVIATFGVIVGLFVSKYTGYNIDGYIGAAVGLFILISGIKFAKESASPLLGEAPDYELVSKVEKLIKSYDIVLGIHDLEVHSYGQSKVFAVCHVEVDSKLDILLVHDTIDCIEHDCMNTLGIHTTLHMDPIVIDDPKTNSLKEKIISILDETIGFKYSIHDFRIVSGPTHTNCVFDVVVPFEIDESDEEITERIKKTIHEKDPSIFAVIDIDHDYNNILDLKHD